MTEDEPDVDRDLPVAMEFEIMEAGGRPHPARHPGWNKTFSVGIRPKVASGRKKAARVRIAGPVHNEQEVDREARRVLVSLTRDGPSARIVPALLVGISYTITKAGKRGGLRRAT